MANLPAMNGPRYWAAMLLANGMSANKTAADPRVHKSVLTVKKWLTDPDFQDLVARYADEISEQVKEVGIRLRENRIAALNDMFLRYQAYLEANTRHPELQDHPAIKTGLIRPVHRVVPIGGGKSEVIVEAEPDHKSAEMMLSLLKQVAQETGEWLEKRSPQGEQVVRSYVIVDAEKDQT